MSKILLRSLDQDGRPIPRKDRCLYPPCEKLEKAEAELAEAKKRIVFLEGLVRPGELTSTG